MRPPKRGPAARIAFVSAILGVTVFLNPNVQAPDLQLAHNVHRPLTAAGERVAGLIERFSKNPNLGLRSLTEYEDVQDPISGAKIGIRAKQGYLGSAQSPGELKPQEREALEALARKRGAMAQGLESVFPVRYGDPYQLRVGKNAVAIKPLHARGVRASSVKGFLAYENAFPGTHVLFNAKPDSTEEFLLLEGPQSPRSFEYQMLPESGVKTFALGADGSLRALDGGGSPLFALSAPVIFDSAGKSVKGSFHLAPAAKGSLLTMSFADDGLRYPLLIDPTWTTAGASTLITGRHLATATLLPNGKVLLAGGASGAAAVSSAELYDPFTGAWSAAGSLLTGRWDHSATLLPNGKVLIAGGTTNGSDSLSSAELYDPAAGNWSATGAMSAVRVAHSATLLSNGKVLVAGGDNGNATNPTQWLSSAEFYDPSAGTWSATGSMSTPRTEHTATALQNGKVLVAAGNNNGTILTSAEIYDPSSGIWAATGSLSSARKAHAAVLLPNGKVLGIGGTATNPMTSCELFDPSSGTWSATSSLATDRMQPTAALLPNGKVLVMGGDSSLGSLSTAELYDVSSASWTFTTPMSNLRWQHTSTLLANGKILVAGGFDFPSSVELYDPALGGWSAGNALSAGRYYHTATLLPTGKVLIAGGYDAVNRLSSAELYDPASGAWSATGSMLSARQQHTATLLPNGKVLVAGGEQLAGYLAAAELYDPGAGTWAATGSMAAARTFHTATLLPNGKVLVAGGYGGSYLSTAELYDPAAGAWTPTGSMSTSRYEHSAVLLSNGKVLAAGGDSGSGLLSTAELYDPSAGTWSATGSMSTSRYLFSMLTLAGGKVLAAAGKTNSGALSTAELYDPAAGTWSGTGSLVHARFGSATLSLPNGKILTAGGQDTSPAYLSSAELYDPATAAWSSAPSMASVRYGQSLTLLPSGRLLIAGGYNNATALASTELSRYSEYDYSSVSPTVQPAVATINGSSSFPATIQPGTSVALTGSLFMGVSEGSGGNFGNSAGSPTNLPRVYLRPNDSGGNGPQMGQGGNWVDVSTSVYAHAFSSTALTIDLPAGLACGYYNLWVMSNAVPSTFTAVQVLPGALSVAPGSPGTAFPSVGASTVTAQWVASAESGVSGYLLEASSAANFTGTLSSGLGLSAISSSAPVSGLLPNATYFFRVASENCAGAGPFTALGSTVTLANPPLNPNASSLGTSSATLVWGANANPSGTAYLAQISTSNIYTTILASSQTFNLSAAFIGLSSNSTYYLRVAAFNSNGVATSFVNAPAIVLSSGPVTPGLAAASFPAVGISSIAAAWSSGGNAAGMTYVSQISTDNFATTNFSTATLALSAVFGSGGAGPALSANSTYYLRIEATDGISSSTFLNMGSTITWANVPASPVVVVTSTMATLSWSANANPNGTAYLAWLSTNNTSAFFSSQTFNASAAFSGLQSNATYFLKVQAINGAGVATAYTSVLTTSTMVAAPLALAPSGIASTAIRANWNTNGNSQTTQYTAQISTDNFATLNAANQTTSSSLNFTGLAASTTYYFRVDALGNDGSVTAWVALASATTTGSSILIPGSAVPTFTGMATNSVTASWTNGGNAAGTTYIAQSSTDNFATTNFSSSTLNLSAVFGALGANSTYYFRVEATNGISTSAFLSLGSTSTLVAIPLAGSPSGITASAITANWSSNGNAATTRYTAQVSTDNFATFNASNNTSTTFFNFSGLAASTTYYFRVDALGNDGSVTAWVALASATTTGGSILIPGSAVPTFTGVTSSSITVSWTSGGNASTITYIAQISTDNFATTNFNSSTPSLSAAFGSGTGGPALGANGTYYFRVEATGGISTSAFLSLGSTMTLANFPVFPAVVVTPTMATLSWNVNANPNGTAYSAWLSTNNTSVFLSSQTFNASAAFSGLQSNTTCYLKVQAVNGAGVATIFTSVLTTSTLVASPLALAPSGISSTTIQANWNTNGNSQTTQYTAQISTDNFATLNTANQTTSSSLNFTGLAASTTYYFRVVALGNDGSVTAWLALASTTTTGGSVLIPGSAVPTFTGVAANSVTASWTNGGNAAGTTYIAQSSTDNFATTNFSSSTLNLSAAFGSGAGGPPLGANVRYYFRAEATNGISTSAFLALGNTMTLANPPSGSTVTAVAVASATLSWSLNGNPSYTLAEVQRSLDNASFASISTAPATSYTDMNLQACTTYYYRVRNDNGNGVPTLFDTTVQFMTANSTPPVPGNLQAQALNGNIVSLTWEPAPAADITRYRIFYDSGTGVVDYAHPLAALGPSATSYTTAVLVSSASYRFAVRATNRCSTEEQTGSFASAAAVTSVAGAQASIKVPQSGKHISGNRVTVVAELASGDSRQTRQVRFQYRVSLASATWADIPATDSNQPNPSLSAPYFVHWDVTGLASGPYDLRAVATDFLNNVDSGPASITISVDPVNFDTQETDLGGGKTQKAQVLSNLVTATVEAADAATSLVTKLSIPAGAVTDSTTTVTVANNPLAVPPPPVNAGSPGFSTQITLANGQTRLAGGQTAAIVLTYPDVNNSGIVDGTTIRADSLKMYSFNTVTNQWVNDIPSTVDLVNHTITGNTPHFSFFAVFAPAATDLGALRVYPMPYKPNGGDPNQGKPFAAGDPASGIFFDNLPPSVTITIYTLTGQRVTKFGSDAGGKIQWNVKNDGGKDVASGGYLAVIASPGQASVVKKLLIIR